MVGKHGSRCQAQQQKQEVESSCLQAQTQSQEGALEAERGRMTQEPTHSDECSLTRLQPHKTPQVAPPAGIPGPTGVHSHSDHHREHPGREGGKIVRVKRKGASLRNTFLWAYHGHCSPELSAAVTVHTKHAQEEAHLCREEFTRSLMSRRICRQLRVAGRDIFFSGALSPRLLTLLLPIFPVKLIGSPSKV